MKLAGMSVPSVPAVPKIKPVKLPAPKIAAVSVKKLPGAFAVQHHMTHGSQPQPFVFTDPSKIISHLARIQRSEWREPGKDPAGAITRDLNLGPV